MVNLKISIHRARALQCLSIAALAEVLTVNVNGAF